MDTCPECGNRDIRLVEVDGATIRECALCGERFGERRAIEALNDRDEAHSHGFAAEIWPLVRALRMLDGLAVEAADPGSAAADGMPSVRLAPAGPAALLQLENLATSLKLGAAELLCPWTIELDYRRHLGFVLRPRSGGLRDARLDLETLGRHIERDIRLSWWRHRVAAP